MRSVLSVALVAALGCAPSSLESAMCPPAGTALTYENFGASFFDAHCIRCHGGGHGYSSRGFTSVERIREDRERIFVTAAADNVSMPPGPDDPPAADRERLAEWLACGAP